MLCRDFNWFVPFFKFLCWSILSFNFCWRNILSFNLRFVCWGNILSFHLGFGQQSKRYCFEAVCSVNWENQLTVMTFFCYLPVVGTCSCDHGPSKGPCCVTLYQVHPEVLAEFLSSFFKIRFRRLPRLNSGVCCSCNSSCIILFRNYHKNRNEPIFVEHCYNKHHCNEHYV